MDYLHHQLLLQQMASIWLFSLATLSILYSVSAWQQGSTPNNFIDYNTTLRTALHFWGGDTSSEYFKILDRDGDSLLVGAQNVMYNISLRTFRENHRTHWKTKDETRQLCQRKGRTSNECHNYIRVFVKNTANGEADGGGGGGEGQEFQMCGTNAFEPQCRTYMKDSAGELVPQIGSETGGVGLVAYDPQYNSSHVYAGGELYSSLAVDAMSMKPAIVRGMLRTSRNNPFHEPNFAGGFADDAFVYFGLRETAVEHINCGKRVVARLARVCRNDRGPRSAANGRISTWTSFSKARLNCSIPGDYPFYFDELHSLATAGPIIQQRSQSSDGVRPRRILYGVFSTPENSITGSAICAYDMADVERVFAGRFKEQRDMNSNWLAVNEDRVVAGVRAATQCTANDSRTELSDAAVRFVETHPLMDEAVPALYGRPVLVATLAINSDDNTFEPMQFRAMDVLPQVPTVDNGRQRQYDVMYVGTSDGRLLKVVNLLVAVDSDNEQSGGGSSAQQSAIVEVQQVLSRREPITSVQIVNDRVVVVSPNELLSLPLEHCSESATCGSCVARQDPHCAWHVKMRRCMRYQVNVAAEVSDAMQSIWIQNVKTGKHADLCLKTTPSYGLEAKSNMDGDSRLVKADNKKHRNQFRIVSDAASDDPMDPSNNIGVDAPLLESRRLEMLTIAREQQGFSEMSSVPEWKASQILAINSNVYREETLAIAIVLTLVLSLSVGFVVGYQMSRWRRACLSERLKDSTNLSVDTNSSNSTADYAQFPLTNNNHHVDSLAPTSAVSNHSGMPLPYRLNNIDMLQPNQSNCNNNMAMMMMMARESAASSATTASTTSAGSGTQKRPSASHSLMAPQQRQMLLHQQHSSFNGHYNHPPPPPPHQLHYNPYAIESLLPITHMGKPLNLVSNVNPSGKTILRHASCVGYQQQQQQQAQHCQHRQRHNKTHNKLLNGGCTNLPATATLPRLTGGTLNRNLNALNTSKAYL